MKVITLPYSSDNFAYQCLTEEGGKASLLIDTGVPLVAESLVQTTEYPLAAVLLTHSHHDHIGGLDAVLAKYPQAEIYAHPSLTAQLGRGTAVSDGQSIKIAGVGFEIYECPMHCRDHVLFKAGKELFSGDVVFSGGCGRFFSGTADEFLTFAERLLAMDDDTRIHFGHEYTLGNLRFAMSVEPGNKNTADYKKKVESGQLSPTTPTTLAHEKKINPFLRYSQEALRPFAESKGVDFSNKAAVIAALRQAKDNF